MEDIESSFQEAAIKKIEEINNYFEYPAFSQSILKTLEFGPEALKAPIETLEKKLYYKEHEHFIIGSGSDCQLTQGLTAFKLQYYLPDLASKPSDAIVSIIKELFDTCKLEGELPSSLTEFSDSAIMAVVDSQGFAANSKWTRETKIGKVLTGDAYYKALIEAGDRQVISEEENSVIDAIVTSFINNRRTAHYFQNKKGIEIIKQLPIYFEYRGHQCKALPDLLIIDHDNETFRVLDINTMAGKTLGFPKSMRLRRYDIQVAFYTLAARTLFKHYNALPPQFLVESNTVPGQPLVYELNNTLGQVAMNGEKEVFWSGAILKPAIIGINQLFDRLEWYQANGTDKHYSIPEDKPIVIDWYGPINDRL